MKEFIIYSKEDFDLFCDSVERYFRACKKQEIKFTPFRIISKKLVKDKTPQAHRYYFALIGELKNAFQDAGYFYTTDQLHYFVKVASGFTKMDTLADGTIVSVPKSIADNSDDIDSEEISKLCEFIKSFAASKLNYYISDDFGL